MINNKNIRLHKLCLAYKKDLDNNLHIVKSRLPDYIKHGRFNDIYDIIVSQPRHMYNYINDVNYGLIYDHQKSLQILVGIIIDKNQNMNSNEVIFNEIIEHCIKTNTSEVKDTCNCKSCGTEIESHEVRRINKETRDMYCNICYRMGIQRGYHDVNNFVIKMNAKDKK